MVFAIPLAIKSVPCILRGIKWAPAIRYARVVLPRLNNRSNSARFVLRSITAVGVLLSAHPALLAAQSPRDTLRLTLLAARPRAPEANPEFVAGRLDTAVAHGQLRQARLFPFNPVVSVLLPGGGVKGRVDPVVSQELKIFGQRGLRVAGAEAEVARASAGIGDVSRITLGDVARAFNRLAAAESRVRLG